MQVSLGELTDYVVEISKHLNLSDDVTELLVDDFVGAHFENRPALGVANLVDVVRAAQDTCERPSVSLDNGGLVIINGNRALGHVTADLALKMLITKSHGFGVAAVGLTNFSRYGRLKPIATRAARMGLSTIMFNGGGPPAISPPGARRAVVGTNPICFAMPGNPPFIADLSSSQSTWAEIDHARRNNCKIESTGFLNSEGRATNDPDCVQSVAAMAGYKGFALASAIELITGAIAGGLVGNEVTSQYQLGAWIIGIKTSPYCSEQDAERSCNSLRKQTAAAVEGSQELHKERQREQFDQNSEKQKQILVEVDECTIKSLKKLVPKRKF